MLSSYCVFQHYDWDCFEWIGTSKMSHEIKSLVSDVGEFWPQFHWRPKGELLDFPSLDARGTLLDANHDRSSQLDTLILESGILNGVLAGKLLDKMSLLNPTGEAQQNKMAP